MLIKTELGWILGVILKLLKTLLYNETNHPAKFVRNTDSRNMCLNKIRYYLRKVK